MTHPVPPQRRTLKWAAVDLDGTLAEPLWTPENPTSAIGAPIWPNMAKVRALVEAGYSIIIHTTRSDTDHEAIQAWARHYGLPVEEIRTGKPLAAVYIDDRGVHAEHPDWVAALKEINP